MINRSRTIVLATIIVENRKLIDNILIERNLWAIVFQMKTILNNLPKDFQKISPYKDLELTH